MNDSNSKASGGISICGLLGVAFIVLKLTKVIDWSWWWVTAPFWAPTAIAIVVLVVCFIIKAICRE